MSDLDIIHWPAGLLTPKASPFDSRAFSRSGGRSLGGIARATRTDKGYWIGKYDQVIFRRGKQFDQARAWNAIRTALGGMVGLIAVPVCATRLWVDTGYKDFSSILTPHDDGTPFDDGTYYEQGRIAIEMASFAPLGSTVATLKLVDAPTVSGIRFSYQYAMYETGRVLQQTDENSFQVEIFPAIRQAIPAGAELDADRPTILCHLATDGEMDIEFPGDGMPRPTINFIEAVDVWNDLALEAA